MAGNTITNLKLNDMERSEKVKQYRAMENKIDNQKTWLKVFIWIGAIPAVIGCLCLLIALTGITIIPDEIVTWVLALLASALAMVFPTLIIKMFTNILEMQALQFRADHDVTEDPFKDNE